MPTWNIYHNPSLFTTTEKQALAKSITEIYVAAGLPPFYVQVRFLTNEPESMYVGGEGRTDGFVALHITHIARNFQNAAHKQGFMSGVDAILDPVLKAKGADWEYFINETPRDLWKINGMVPPASNSEAEREWVRENRAMEYEGSRL